MNQKQEKFIYDSINEIVDVLHNILVTSHSQESLREKLLLHLSSTTGFKIFLEENFILELKNIEYRYQYGQNPTCFASLFTSECRHSTRCQNPCCFRHNKVVRPKDLLSITKFKLIMMETILSLINQPSKIYFDYQETDLRFLKDSIFSMTVGLYPKSKLILMNHVYDGTLFRLGPTSSRFRDKDELNNKISYGLKNNKVGTLSLFFVLSLCYLQPWIVDSVYSIMRLNGVMTNVETSHWRILFTNEIKNLILINDLFNQTLEEKDFNILFEKLRKELFKLTIQEQKKFVYFATLDEKIKTRNSILQRECV